MPPDDFAPVFIITLVIIAMVLILRGPLGKALARRLEGTAGRDDTAAHGIAGLSERLAELEQRDARVAELEERLDFAERLLAQRDAERLPRGRDD
jgi:flagellar motility protein MotE (MotC chaperone)